VRWQLTNQKYRCTVLLMVCKLTRLCSVLFQIEHLAFNKSCYDRTCQFIPPCIRRRTKTPVTFVGGSLSPQIQRLIELIVSGVIKFRVRSLTPVKYHHITFRDSNSKRRAQGVEVLPSILIDASRWNSSRLERYPSIKIPLEWG